MMYGLEKVPPTKKTEMENGSAEDKEKVLVGSDQEGEDCLHTSSTWALSLIYLSF